MCSGCKGRHSRGAPAVESDPTVWFCLAVSFSPQPGSPQLSARGAQPGLAGGPGGPGGSGGPGGPGSPRSQLGQGGLEPSPAALADAGVAELVLPCSARTFTAIPADFSRGQVDNEGINLIPPALSRAPPAAAVCLLIWGCFYWRDSGTARGWSSGNPWVGAVPVDWELWGAASDPSHCLWLGHE